MKRITPALAIAAAIAFNSVPADAHEFPTKAKQLKSSLVQNYAPCLAPDTATNGGTPACGGEPDPVDTQCTFASKSQGSLTVAISKTDLKVKASLKGLSPACDGETLTIALGVRTTTDDCPGGHCTVIDQEVTGGTCTVAGGKCSISTAIPSGYSAGAGSEMTILTCGVRHGALDAFACGVMVP
ncbi:MAG TPA: hypothetical protein VMS22_18220 [Candidatus Eisenbacteria bacterium]|nr:hypothetical protein [Candidatus Eisenbacteria bacterium]